MSAWLCDPRHIGGLASYLCNRRAGKRDYGSSVDRMIGVTPEAHVPLYSLDRSEQDRAPRVAVILARENIASVAYRYPHDGEGERPGPVGIPTDLDYTLLCVSAARRHLVYAVELDPAQILKAADCLEYQSCEHPGWEKSVAHELLGLIRRLAYTSLPGYEMAEWGWPEDPRPVRPKVVR